MDKRLILNVIIVAIVSFYLIFGIVYRGLFEESVPDLSEESQWQQPYLVPKGWTLSHIEFPDSVILKLSASGWTAGESISKEAAALLANNWHGLVIQDVSGYETLPAGSTALGFVDQQVQPIVYRLVIVEQEMHIYRLTDQRLFKLPIDLKSVLWIN